MAVYLYMDWFNEGLPANIILDGCFAYLWRNKINYVNRFTNFSVWFDYWDSQRLNYLRFQFVPYSFFQCMLYIDYFAISWPIYVIIFALCRKYLRPLRNYKKIFLVVYFKLIWIFLGFLRQMFENIFM